MNTSGGKMKLLIKVRTNFIFYNLNAREHENTRTNISARKKVNVMDAKQ